MKLHFATVVVASLLTAGNAAATAVTLDMYADDYGTLSIDGTLVGSYDDASSAGNIVVPLNLSPGWHEISMGYANRAGTNALLLSWEFPGDPGYSGVPLTDLRSPDQSGASLISGLQAEYYASLGGSYLFTIFGEGPIVNYAASFTAEFYEGQPGLWAGQFGPSADFAEHLNGEIFIPGVAPEPSSLSFLFVGALALFGLRLRHSVLRRRS